MVKIVGEQIKNNWSNIRLVIEVVVLFIMVVVAFVFNSNSQQFNEATKKLDAIILNVNSNSLYIKATDKRIEKIEAVNEWQDDRIQDSRERLIRIEGKVFKNRRLTDKNE